MTSAAPEKMYANTQNFAEIDADTFQVLGNRILVQWLQAHDEYKAGKITLVRPETHKGAHFTGIILGVGNRVDEDVKKGMRILFQQFAGFEKLFDPKYGRLALIQASDAMAILPPRMKVEGLDGDYDYDA